MPAQRLDEWHQQTGFDQKALDRAAKAGFANGAFEDSAEESIDVVEEFYPDAPEHPPGEQNVANAPVTLADKLQAKSQPPKANESPATESTEAPVQSQSRQAKRA